MKQPEDSTASTATPARIQLLPHGQIVPGNNPRTHFDADKHEELRASMREHGFQEDQPMLVRPKNEVKIVEDVEDSQAWFSVMELEKGTWVELDGAREEEKAILLMQQARKFEIVKGECRWRAAGAEKIAFVPAVIRAMSDSEAMVLALIENMQRQDLNPMEEAMGLDRLDGMLRLEHPDWNDKQRYEVIRLKTGRATEMFVRQRLSLCRLSGEKSGAALAAGRLPASHGRMIATLPTRELRERVAAQVLATKWGDGCMPQDQLRLLLLDYKRELRGAKFDPKDATLIGVLNDPATGERVGGGACTDCPMNSKNLPDGEGGSKFHSCLNPVCFGAKETAVHDRWVQTMKADGKTAFSEAENAGLWDDSGKGLAADSDFVELDELPARDELKPDTKLNAKRDTWRHLTKGRAMVIYVGRDAGGKAHELAKHDVAVAAAVANGHAIFKGAPEESHTPRAETRAESAADQLKREEEAKQRRADADAAAEERELVWMAEVGAVIDGIQGKAKTGEGFFHALYGAIGNYFIDGLSLAAGRRGIEHGKLETLILKGPESGIAGLLVETILQQGYWEDSENAEGNLFLKRLAKSYGVDVKAAAKTARTELKARRATEAKAAEIAGGMEWKPGVKAGEEHRFNDSNVAENPDRCELSFPKASKITASVSVAAIGREWVGGWFVQGPKFGTSDPCSAGGVKYDSRALAVRAGLLGIRQQLLANKAGDAVLKSIEAWLAEVAGKTPEPPAPSPKAKKAKAKKGPPLPENSTSGIAKAIAAELKGRGITFTAFADMLKARFSKDYTQIMHDPEQMNAALSMVREMVPVKKAKLKKPAKKKAGPKI